MRIRLGKIGIGLGVGQGSRGGEAVRNVLPNSSFQGAAVGVVGSGGSLPTGFSAAGFDTVEIVSVGTHLGQPLLRLKCTRANAGGGSVFPYVALMGLTTPCLASTQYNLSGYVQVGAENSVSSLSLQVDVVHRTVIISLKR